VTNSIRILHLTLNMDIGGTEQVIKQLVAGLDSNRYQCAVACIDNRVGSMGEELRLGGIDVFALPRQSGLDWSLVTMLRKLVKEQRYDILHCHQYSPYSYGALAALTADVKVIFTEHGRFHPDRFTWKRRLVNQLLRFGTDSTTAISSATKDALVKYEWLPKKNISVIYNGIAAPSTTEADQALRQSLGLSEQHQVLGTISRLDPIKNQIMMIDAFQQVRSTFPNARLLIVGDGAERQRLEQHVAELKLSNDVIFTGFQSKPEPYLDLIDVFLLSSYSEGTSMTLLEAMAKGKPCVVTNVGGNPEVVSDGVDGFLVESGNTTKFAEAIATLLSSDSLYASVGSAAQATFNNRFELSHMIGCYEALYKTVTR